MSLHPAHPRMTYPTLEAPSPNDAVATINPPPRSPAVNIGAAADNFTFSDYALALHHQAITAELYGCEGVARAFRRMLQKEISHT